MVRSSPWRLYSATMGRVCDPMAVEGIFGDGLGEIAPALGFVWAQGFGLLEEIDGEIVLLDLHQTIGGYAEERGAFKTQLARCW